MAKVSVIIPVYNTERYVAECLDSLLAQTFQDFEVFSIDDGSSDGSLAIVQRYADADPRFHVLAQQNRGAGAARNLGLEKASGTYLLFLDSDDFLEASYLDEMIRRADEASADVVLCQAYSFDDNTHEEKLLEDALCGIDYSAVASGAELADRLFQCCKGWPWDKIFRRSFVMAHNLTFQELRTTNDARFVFMALCEAERIASVERPLIYHRVGNGASLENTRSRSWENSFSAIEGIREGLEREGIFVTFKKSFDNWVANYLRWHFFSLPAETQEAMMGRLSTFLRENLPLDDSDYYADQFDFLFVQKAVLLHSELLVVAHDDDHRLYWLQKELDSLRIGIEERDRYIDELHRSVDELERSLENMRNSHSYKIGRTITAPVRALRSNSPKA